MLPAKIIQAYGETGSLEKTAARIGVAPNTVRAILERNPEDFANAKKALATRMLAVAGDAVEIAGQRLDECSGPQAAVVAGIMTDKHLVLTDKMPSANTISVAVLYQSQALLARLEDETAAIRACLEGEQGLPASGSDEMPAPQ
jgi:hypothetical protein